MDVSLLEIMQARMNCEYLSDLHQLSDVDRKRLSREWEKIRPEDASLREWNDALAYLSNNPPEQSAEAARERLIQSLSQPR